MPNGPDWDKVINDALENAPGKPRRRKRTPEQWRTLRYTVGWAAVGTLFFSSTAIGFAAKMLPGTSTSEMIGQTISCCGGSIVGMVVGGFIGHEMAKQPQRSSRNRRRGPSKW